MHSINLNDNVYSKALKLASDRGYRSVDEFIAEVIETEVATGTEDCDRLFTPEVLDAIDRGVADAKAGRVFAAADMGAHLAQWREEWRKDQAS